MKTFLFAGCCSIGRRHIKNLKQLIPCRILAWRVRNEDLGVFEKETGLETFKSYEEALEQKPDAVFVTNPTSLHLETARMAALRGIPLFIEKPVSHTLEGVDDFIKICRERNIPVLLGYKMRFHPSIKVMKKLIEEGAIGRPLTIRAHYGGCLKEWHPWEDYRRMYSSRKDLGGGVILDAIHELDYVYWLMGDAERVESVTGRFSDLEIETEDLAEILLKFKSRSAGSVSLNYFQYPESRYCVIVGTEGTIRWHPDLKRVECFQKSSGSWTYYDEPAQFQTNDMFLDLMRHFLAVLENRERPIHTLEDARRVLEIALCARDGKSLSTGT